MGIFDGFKRKKMTQDIMSRPEIQEMKRQTAEDNREIEFLQNADRQYETDNDIEKRIAAYESILKKGTRWNSFNFHLSLVSMYVKTERNNEAWGHLNFISMQFPGEYETQKIRHEQFKILKKEKNYLNALRTLSVYHVLYTNTPKGSIFDVEKFIKEGKTTAKGLGLSDDQFRALANRLNYSAHKYPNKEKDVIAIYDSFAKEQGLV